jgi:UDP-N-acetylmuramate dehydrogenase
MSVTSSLIQTDADLKPYNTLNVQATARHLARVCTAEELQEILHDDKWSLEKKFILGGGSNVLFTGDFDGLIIHVAIEGREIVDESEKNVRIKTGAGENWHETVRYCVQKGWGGIENLSLIPGTVGAAPIQNIGAYGVELEDVFESLTAVEMKTGELRTFEKADCRFGYRDSIFKQELKGQYMVTDVTLELSKQPELNTSYGAVREKLEQENIAEPTITDISDLVIEIRNSKLPDPTRLANAGSFFKNPVVSMAVFEDLKKANPSIPGYAVDGEDRGCGERVKVPAGWLIEQAGWKGKVVGKVGTYRQQALVIVNHGGASGSDILQLSRQIQQSVQEQFNIMLAPEVNIVE